MGAMKFATDICDGNSRLRFGAYITKMFKTILYSREPRDVLTTIVDLI
jgi:hypothetical protein